MSDTPYRAGAGPNDLSGPPDYEPPVELYATVSPFYDEREDFLARHGGDDEGGAEAGPERPLPAWAVAVVGTVAAAAVCALGYTVWALASPLFQQ